jgi:hypothetical protein
MNCPKHHDKECAPGRSRCEECLSSLRDYQRRRREKLLSEGRCVGTVTRPTCTNPPREGKTMCQVCADTFNEYQNSRNAEKRRKRGEAA